MEPEYDQESTDKLLAALYGAEDESGALEGELGAELEACRSLRSLFADLPDEDAPTGINAKLISAAAKAVAPKKDSVSLWDRVLEWFAPLRAHPALSAAASLVLVASIGGILYVKGKGDFADEAPQSDQKSAERPALRAASDEAEVTETDQPDLPDDLTRLGTAKEAANPAQPVSEPTDRAVKKPRFNGSTKAGKARVVGQTGGVKGTSAGEKTKADVSTTVDLPVLEASKNRKTRGLPGAGAGDDQAAGSGANKTEPKTEPDADGDKKQTRGPTPEPAPPSEDAKPAPTKPTKRELKRLETLRKQAVGFAKNGDCTSVKKLGKTVQGIDEAFYDRSFLSDATIGTCYRVSK